METYGWKLNPPHWSHGESEGFYKKKIIDDICAEIIIYKHGVNDVFELKIQIPSEKSITGMTININSFTYKILCFSEIEENAKQIIKKLIK